MPRDGSGNYSAPAGQPVSTGTSISSTVHNTLVTDLAAALTASIAKDGQTSASANLPMGGNRHTGVGDASARNQYAAAGQVADNDFATLGSVSGTNTITGSLTPAITAYVAGMHITFVPANTNTAAATLAVSGLTALDILKGSGTALAAGDMVAGVPAHLICDGDDFYLLNPLGALPALNGAALTALNASNLASGTVPDARFPATLPALSGANLTALNASNLASGTVPEARVPTVALTSGTIDSNKIGYLHMPQSGAKTGNYTLVAADAGTCVLYTGSGGHTFTLPSSVMDQYSLVNIKNAGSGALSITSAASALTWYNGSGTLTTAATRTLAVGGMISVWFTTSTAQETWGTGLT